MVTPRSWDATVRNCRRRTDFLSSGKENDAVEIDGEGPSEAGGSLSVPCGTYVRVGRQIRAEPAQHPD